MHSSGTQNTRLLSAVVRILKIMNYDEQVAFDFLQKQFKNERVVYEPDGNVPPDFLVNSELAVEVRRLNLNDLSSTKPIAIEEQSISLENSVDNLLASFGQPTNGKSWFVTFVFLHPIKPWREERIKLKNILNKFLTNHRESNLSIQVDRIRVSFIASTEPQSAQFCCGGVDICDPNSGWLIPDLQANIEHCANEKLKKISRYHDKYETWWLVLVDHIAFGLHESDVDRLRSCLNLSEGWGKVILIDGVITEHSTEF